MVVGLFFAWSLYERGKQYLPAPLRAVANSLDQASGPGVGAVSPIGDPGPSGPLTDCPEFADYVRAIYAAMSGTDSTQSSRDGEYTDVLVTEVQRMDGGGPPAPIESNGTAAALEGQAQLLTNIARHLRAVSLQTQQASSLTVSTVAGLEAMVAADNRLLASGNGARTRVEWIIWARDASAPYAQVTAVFKALKKCLWQRRKRFGTPT